MRGSCAIPGPVLDRQACPDACKMTAASRRHLDSLVCSAAVEVRRQPTPVRDRSLNCAWTQACFSVGAMVATHLRLIRACTPSSAALASYLAPSGVSDRTRSGWAHRRQPSPRASGSVAGEDLANVIGANAGLTPVRRAPAPAVSWRRGRCRRPVGAIIVPDQARASVRKQRTTDIRQKLGPSDDTRCRRRTAATR